MRDDEQVPFPTLTHLGSMPISTFLKDYWQQKPLLIRQAFSEFSSILSPDEIAGLSLEDDVVSRLVIENPQTQQWSVEHGPLEEEHFSQLPESHWSLLIQHADSLDPELNALLNAFRFIPNWRLDDIMVSYAPDAGGVGPHFDYFDVFLLQAEGQRRWRIGQHCDHTSALIPDCPMKILQQFETREDWIVEPGDLLYIPAQYAHWGEAIGESITYSIGFRAPSHTDILLDYSQEIAAQSHEDQRYRDNDLHMQQHPGEITSTSLQQFQDVLKQLSETPEELAIWIGTYTTRLTQNIEGMYTPLTLDDLRTKSNRERLYQLSSFCRSAFHTTSHKAQTPRTYCFINGDYWQCSEDLAMALAHYKSFHIDDFCQADQDVITELCKMGLLTL